MHARSRARRFPGLGALVVALAAACGPEGGGETAPATSITGAEVLTGGTGGAGDASTSSSSGAADDASSSSSSSSGADVETSAVDPGYCGDKIVQEGEECDEGSGNSAKGGCLPGCIKNVCGDGSLWAGVEECDLGEDNDDNWKCTSECKTNVCGDGLRIKYIEECDEGEANADDGACTPLCTKNVCGDGFVHKGVEECDDGGRKRGDGCSEECEREQVTFLTAELFTGDLGGIAGADAKCQEAAKLGGYLPWAGEKFTYKAWLAAPGCAPANRFPPSDRPYRRVDSYEVAWSFADLTDGDLDLWNVCSETHSCAVGEDDLPVWTGVKPDGKNGPDLASSTCNYWTLDGDFFFGKLGNARYRDPRWSMWTDKGAWVTQGCNTPAHLYCIQIDCLAYPEYCEPDYCGG